MRRIVFHFLIFAALYAGISVFSLARAGEFRSGLENLFTEKYLHLIRGKNVALVVNHTSVNRKGQHLAVLIREYARLRVIFSPEHGVDGNIAAGGKIGNSERYGTRVVSLYGDYKTPPPGSLAGIDVIVYDMQDTGARFYTYISTLYHVMSAAARDDVPMLVLDRPLVAPGRPAAGALMNPSSSSFVGIFPLPVQYGMTAGELALMYAGESYGAFSLPVRLQVVPMSGYEAGLPYENTGLPWVAPSPNIPDLSSARIYAGTGLFEGSNLSEGRGTYRPFLTLGAPFIEPEKWLAEIPPDLLQGFRVKTLSFTPVFIQGRTENIKYKNQLCHGIELEVVSAGETRPVELAVALLAAAARLYPQQFRTTAFLDRLWGNENLRALLARQATVGKILALSQKETDLFRKKRLPYLLYP